MTEENKSSLSKSVSSLFDFGHKDVHPIESLQNNDNNNNNNNTINSNNQGNNNVDNSSIYSSTHDLIGPHHDHHKENENENQKKSLDDYIDLVLCNPYMNFVKRLGSLALTALSLYILITGWIGNHQVFATSIPGWVEGLIFSFLVFYLVALLEGIQVSIVSFITVDCSYFEHSHPTAFHIMKLIKSGRNLDAFIEGRQVMVTVIVFFASHLSAFGNWNRWPNSPHPAFSAGFKGAFLEYSLAGLVVTVFLAQITSQIVFARAPITMMNLPLNRLWVYLSIAIQLSGITFITRLIAFAWLKIIKDPIAPANANFHQSIHVHESPFLDDLSHIENVKLRNFLHVIHTIAKTCFALWTLFCLYLLCAAWITGHGIFITSIPGYGRGLLYFAVAFYFVSMLEGVQICILKCIHGDYEWFEHSHPQAYKIVKLCKKGHNFSRFLEGRQVFVTAFVFFCSNLTALGDEKHWAGTHKLMPASFQSVMMTYSVAGIFVTVLMAQLVPRLVCSAAPISVMNLWGNYYIIWACLLLEKLGLASFSQVLGEFYLWFLKDPPKPVEQELEERRRRQQEEEEEDQLQDQVVIETIV